MIGALIGLLIVCVIAGVFWWAAQRLLALVPLAEPFATIAQIVIVLITVLVVIYVFIWLLGIAGIHVALPHLG